jgi:hypothetical protein
MTMSLLQQVFSEGLRSTLRRWHVMLPLYIFGLLLGLVQTWPLLGAGSAALHNPFLGELAAGSGDANITVLLSDPATVGQTAGLWAGATLLLALLFGLAYNFFSGGVLSVYTETGSFWSGCRRMFWSFTGLGVLLVLLALIIVVLATILSGLVGARGATIVALVLLQLVNVTGEYARALAVVRNRRNPIALLGMAMGFCRRHLAGVLALALVGLLLHAALAVLYGQLAGALAGAALVILLQQLVVLAWLWVKLLRLAWAASYVRAAERPEGMLSLEEAPLMP